ncbi:TonB-dependent receptor [Mucilaginibacter sp. 14171R-50]|uniref:outer membrane beta-barrel family protein n=1 Tax=Mucilaginibacter sp. 14171R-50 TaxID=2703789 RepID=UPI00138B22B8|nr:outer membrane beta-barrel family protein [Mucilaginibacter sp. 14171R-50]QHS57739.1 TonB-dependent receptor [Mucilaginibacter sp. 14171R-50]
MMPFKTAACCILLSLCALNTFCQQANSHDFFIAVLNESAQPAEAATVKLQKDNATVLTAVTDNKGLAHFKAIKAGTYTFVVTYTGYQQQTTPTYQIPGKITSATVTLQPASTSLNEVSVVARTPPIQHQQGKVILDVGASVTNTGLTVLEVLEKSPGVMVDKNGGISLNGKPGVLVMIDSKPTYLSGADLNNLLTSMSSTQVAQIELIANPTARYDANGNAGIINIKTKKNNIKGFNGSLTTAFGQGIYPKNTNSLVLNYRVGKVNTFLNYNVNYVEYMMDIYALRKYYDPNGALTAMFDQYSYLPGNSFNNTLKTGMDYFISPKTTIGFAISGTTVKRNSSNRANANWLSPQGVPDSAINTTNESRNRFKNGTINLNLRHGFSASQDLEVNADYLHYDIKADQTFENQLVAANGYHELSRGNIPTGIRIASAKADYTLKLNKTDALALGWKSSLTNTDNLAAYENLNGSVWEVDNAKTNHFIYKENIHALYGTLDKKMGKVSGQLGLRYEHTGYNAHQLGNAVQPDSSFSRKYSQLFPSGYLTYQADSVNSFTLTASRRIDRPPFQLLNPFYAIINKYTYSTGNPYLLPQLSWNFELSHQYKELLTTTASYSRITNYFSQIFLSAPNDDAILLYTQGNVGSTYNLGLSATLVTSPVKWWSVTAQALYNHKQLRGFNGNSFTTEIDQLNVNVNNQFTIGKYTAELTGFYTTKARNDVQELLYPTGQVSVGLSRPIFGKKGTLRLNARDLFFTNAMEGFTSFPNATEYFLLHRDTRVVTLSFTYRFGKSYKTTKRAASSATDEMERVGNG